jgi:hypothetical protein
LLTFATHQKGALSALVERGKAVGFLVQVIGVGTTWRGFGWRMKSYYQQILKMLRSSTPACRPDDLIILVDGYDVVPFGTPSDVLDGFQRYGTDVLFSAESNCTPYMLPPGEDPFKLYLPQNCDHPFLNAGGIVGRASPLALFLGDVIKSRKIQDDDDDQAAFTRYYLSHLQIHAKRRETAGLLPIRDAGHPIVCVVESSDNAPNWKYDTQDLDLALTVTELSGTKKSTAIKLSLDTNCQVFQCSEFDEQFLLPRPQMGRYGRYWNSRTKTYPSFFHLPGKPAMLNLTRVLECKSLFDPRELLEAICKGASSEKRSSEGSSSVSISRAEIKQRFSSTHVRHDFPKEKSSTTEPKSSSDDQDPIEKLESYVTKYGDEASKHIAAGMKILSQRLPQNLLPTDETSKSFQ